MSSDSGRPTSTEHSSKHARDGNRDHKLRKTQQSSPTLRHSDVPRSHSSTTGADTGTRRHVEAHSATRSVMEPDPRKPPTKRPKESHPPSSDGHEVDGVANPHVDSDLSRQLKAPSSNEFSKKGYPSTGDYEQSMRGVSNRSIAGAELPSGAAPPAQPSQLRQESDQAALADIVTISRRGSRAAIGSESDDASNATPSVADGQPAVDPEDIEQDTATDAIDAQSKSSDETDSRTPSDSEATTQEGAGIASGMLGGIANVLGMRPLTTREARLERDNHRLKDDNKLLRSAGHEWESAARKYHRDAYHFHHENQRLKETVEAMNLEVKGVTRRYEEAKSLSETRGKELLGAQVFLTKADALSMSELIQKVDGLNDEIYQAAASLGESIVQKKIESSEQPHHSAEEGSIAKNLLGSALCQILRSKAQKPDEGVNPLLVQITLQAFFTVFCTHRIRSWTPANSNFDAALQSLYAKIWSSSDQAVSGRWRALTRGQLKPDTNEWVQELITGLDAILALSSWEISSSEDRHTLQARLPAIFKVVLDVREAIGEKFTSADIEVGYVDPGVLFNDKYMEENYEADEGGQGNAPKIVISTVGMGLRKVMLWQGSRAHEYVVSPKVVLESSLKAVLEPPPPRPTRSKSTRR